MENNENIVKIDLSQSLRERVTFETFATDEQKADHKMLKEESLKEKFRHIWFVGFCNLVDSHNQSDTEIMVRANGLANKSKIFSARLKEAGYITLAHKIINSSGSYLLDNNITKNDLN
jgi:hypothetical protein